MGIWCSRAAVSYKQKAGRSTREKRAGIWQCDFWGKPDKRRASKGKRVVVQSLIQKSPTNKTNNSKKCECPAMVYAKPNKCNEWELCRVVLEHKNHTPNVHVPGTFQSIEMKITVTQSNCYGALSPLGTVDASFVNMARVMFTNDWAKKYKNTDARIVMDPLKGAREAWLKKFATEATYDGTSLTMRELDVLCVKKVEFAHTGNSPYDFGYRCCAVCASAALDLYLLCLERQHHMDDRLYVFDPLTQHESPIANVESMDQVREALVLRLLMSDFNEMKDQLGTIVKG
ncbi:Sodium channel protein type 2 subunit alpha [Bienertia sinuspersici]